MIRSLRSVLLVASALALAVPMAGGSPVAASAALNGCFFTASPLDLNGDGFDDAVVGNPYATVAGHQEAGSITVLFGDADGRVGQGVRRVLTQASVPGSKVETGDHFGWSVSINDVTSDGCADILVGSPGEDWQGHRDAGIAQLISFTPDANGGPGKASSMLLSQQAVVGGAVEAGDQFGSTVAAGTSNGDESILAVGAPEEDLGPAADAGEVDVFGLSFGPPSGRQLRQGTDHIPGTPQAGDRFGAALVLGQLAWPTDGDVPAGPGWGLLVGAPGDVVSGHDNAGTVTAYEFDGPAVAQYSQDSAKVSDTAEAGDRFGASVALSEPKLQSTRRLVAVGAPGEDVGAVADAGAVTVFTSTTAGLTERTSYTQGSPRVPGSPEAGDRFGYSVAFRATGPVLAVGVPYEDVGKVVDAGQVVTFDLQTSDEDDPAPVSWTEASAGTPGDVRAGNRFGLTVAGIQGIREELLAFASPYQGSGSVFLLSQPLLGNAGHRSWVPGKGGISSAGGGRFGWSTSGFTSQS